MRTHTGSNRDLWIKESILSHLTKNSQHILDSLSEQKGMTQKRIEQMSGLSQSSVNRGVRRLVSAGLAYTRHGGEVHKAAWSPNSPDTLGLIDELEDCGMVAQ